MLHTAAQMDPGLIGTFILAGLLLNITPGVDFLYVSSSGVTGGPRIGMAAAVGVNFGIVLHIAAAAAGVSALLLAYPAAYTALKYAGAAYLLWIAVQSWRASSAQHTAPAPSIPRAIRRGFLTNALNPKTALFIFAFLPQFTQAEAGPIWHQIVILGTLFWAFGFAFSLALGAAAGRLAAPLKRHTDTLTKTTSLLLAGLAARLLLTD
ncbi:LysE family translocator [Alphaproteobacteria bacterium KMM 3653]|uniref:LysE family translocator n=1 Tax=Harenicola maris TaxID=2841044 RepID=A0AAP2G322_9RHOB|nr:LysE family translocator [Harenicola maris]